MPTRAALAQQISRYGDREVSTCSNVLLLRFSTQEALIKTLVAPVNHMYLEIPAGHRPVTKHDPFPFVHGVGALSVIEKLCEALRGWERGQRVITMKKP